MLQLSLSGSPGTDIALAALLCPNSSLTEVTTVYTYNQTQSVLSAFSSVRKCHFHAPHEPVDLTPLQGLSCNSPQAISIIWGIHIIEAADPYESCVTSVGAPACVPLAVSGMSKLTNLLFLFAGLQSGNCRVSRLDWVCTHAY